MYTTFARLTQNLLLHYSKSTLSLRFAAPVFAGNASRRMFSGQVQDELRKASARATASKEGKNAQDLLIIRPVHPPSACPNSSHTMAHAQGPGGALTRQLLGDRDFQHAGSDPQTTFLGILAFVTTIGFRHRQIRFMSFIVCLSWSFAACNITFFSVLLFPLLSLFYWHSYIQFCYF